MDFLSKLLQGDRVCAFNCDRNRRIICQPLWS